MRLQPLYIRLQPLHLRLQPRHIRLQVATAVAGDGEALPTEASMVWLLDVERLRDNERDNQREVELRDNEGDNELLDIERLGVGASAGPAASRAGSTPLRPTPLRLVLEALDSALTSEAVRVLSY